MINIKEAFGYLAVLAAIISYASYIIGIIRKKAKPHLFSWLIWGMITSITFSAQYSDEAGPGAWSTGLSSICLLGIALLAIWYGEDERTRSDWIAFLSTTFAIPLWCITNDPLWSILLVTLIDIVAYFPTLRKSYVKPHEEIMIKYIFTVLKYAASIVSINKYSLVTVLYPAISLFMDLLMVCLLILRRKALPLA